MVFNRALKSPGWRPEWHVGVRATRSRKLVASICAVPTQLRVRKNSKPMGEVNFLCIHKKLRSKRLAPVLIKEVTRRINLDGIYQAIYTAGIILPRPVSSCRYFHRPINWLKLYETGFSPMPAGATKERMIRRNQLPPQTNTPGFRPMQESDIDAVLNLLNRYLSRFDLAQEFTRDEVDHWLFNKTANPHDRVIWSFVADGDGGGPITDFVSFYSLESSVIQAGKHASVRAAYLYYYATETAFVEKERGLRERLQILISDALIEAKKVSKDRAAPDPFESPFHPDQCILNLDFPFSYPFEVQIICNSTISSTCNSLWILCKVLMFTGQFRCVQRTHSA